MDSNSRKIARMVFAALLGVIGLQWLYSDFVVATDPRAAAIPDDDYRQYIAGWPSGTGVKEVTEFIAGQAALPGKPVLLSVGGFGRHGAWAVQPKLAGTKGLTIREGFIDTPEALSELALATRDFRVLILEETPVYPLTPALLALAKPAPKPVFSLDRTIPRLGVTDGSLRVWEVSPRMRVKLPFPPGAPVPADEPPSIESIVNPNGMEGTKERPFFWIGAGQTSVIVKSGRKGTLRLEGEFRAGPSVAGKPNRDLLIMTSGGYEEVKELGTGPATLAIPVEAGRTRIQLIGLDTKVVSKMANGDPRPLLIGVDNLRVAGIGEGGEAATGCSMTISGTYGAEKMAGGGWFRWTEREVALHLLTSREATVVVDGEYVSSVRPAKVQMLLEGASVGVLEIGPRQDKMQAIPALELNLPAGSSTLVLRTDKVGTKPPGDTRVLSFLVANLRATLKDSGKACEVR